MSESYTIDSLINSITNKESEGQEKVAEETPSESLDLHNEIRDAISSVKEASSSDNSGIEKTASDLADQDQEVMLREARMYGSAMADGYIAKIAEYEKAAALYAEELEQEQHEETIKIASEHAEEYEKWAYENPEEAEHLIELGRQSVQEELLSEMDLIDKTANTEITLDEHFEALQGLRDENPDLFNQFVDALNGEESVKQASDEELALEKFAEESPEEAEHFFGEGVKLAQEHCLEKFAEESPEEAEHFFGEGVKLAQEHCLEKFAEESPEEAEYFFGEGVKLAQEHIIKDTIEKFAEESPEEAEYFFQEGVKLAQEHVQFEESIEKYAEENPDEAEAIFAAGQRKAIEDAEAELGIKLTNEE